MTSNSLKNSPASVEQMTKRVDSVFLATLGISLLLHAFILVFVMNVEMPPPPSQEQYSEWVKRIAAPPREAVLAPIVEEVYKPSPESEKKGEEAEPTEEGASTGAKQKTGSARDRSGSPSAGAGRGTPGGGKGAGGPGAREGVRQAVSGRGVLGVIGVASGGGGEFADVFSEGGGVSEDLGAVMEGKRGVALPGAGTQIGRKRLGGGSGEGSGEGGGEGGGGVAGPADIGGVGVAAGGEVKTSKRKEVEIPSAQVGSGDADVLSGSVDRKSASSAIARKSSGFRRCYERGLKANPDLRGKLVFEITIGADGKVVDVRFVEDSLKSKEVSDCIKGILMRLVFAKPEGGIASLRNSLVFEPQQ